MTTVILFVSSNTQVFQLVNYMTSEVPQSWSTLENDEKNQTEAEGVPSQRGRGDALLRRIPHT